MVLMVSGYWYTSRDLNSRFKIRRSSGWDVYFLVALYGCIFVLQGVFATGIIWLVLLCISGIANAVQMIPGVHLKWQVEFMNWSFLGIQAPVVIMLAFAILLCLYRSNWAGSARLNVSGRKDLYQQLSRSNGVEQLLFQCMEEGELAWITMKSRRIYIGMIHASTFEYESTKNIVLIPMLSGYRDSKTLKLAGATPFGYKIAEQFGLNVYPTRAALVPFTLHKPLLEQLQTLSGVALDTTIDAQDGTRFKEAMLFTHRGLSGPAVLQISSYWLPGEFVTIDLLPATPLEAFLTAQREAHPNLSLKNSLAKILPKRLVEVLQALKVVPDITLKQLNSKQQTELAQTLHAWRIQPNGTEGYRTAEVTLGGVDTTQLSSKTMEARAVPGLYFIGEVADVTGWLGGYNFQWAWSSAWACAQAL